MFLLFFILMLASSHSQGAAQASVDCVTQHALGLEVIEGAESVVLTCEAPAGKASSVVWSRKGLEPSTVHLRTKTDQQPEKDVHKDQNSQFTNRTEVQPDALTTGHVSLTLKHIQLSDEGIYSCLARGGGERLTDKQVQLKVISKEEDEARRQRDALIAVGIIILVILCIVAVVLVWLYRSGYIWQKDLQVEVDPGVESVLLRCRTIRLPNSLPKDVRVQWTAGDRMVHVSLTGSDQPGEQDRLYRGRTEMKRNLRILVDLSLTLKHPTYRDSKTYTCTVSSREGDVLMERHVELEVKVQQVVEVDLGKESVLLPCETRVQLPEDFRVQWTDGDRMVHVSLKDSDQPGEQHYLYRGRTEMKRETPGDLSLTLKHPTGRDSKTYTCTVYSREGDVLMERHVMLEVKVPEVVVVDSGVESVLLPCETTVQLPEDVTVQWMVRDNLVHESLKGSDQLKEQDYLYKGRTEMKRERPGDLSLTLKHPTVRDNKIYTCTVYSMEGDFLMRRDVWFVVLGLLDPQVEVDSGVESVLLPCEGTGQLPEDVRVQWTDRDNLIVHVSLNGSDQHGEQDDLYRGRTEMKREGPGDLSLTLKHPTGRDRKTYTCTVYSREEDILMRRDVKLKVKEPPVEVEQGAESVLLPFKTTELPGDVNVTWRRLNPVKTVHVFQDSSDQQDRQDLSYRGDTEMKRDLRQGDVSLTLKHPTERDTGRYICRVYSKEEDIRRLKTVELRVKGRQVEVKEGEESVLQPEDAELTSTHEGYQLVNMDPAES